MAGVAKTAPAKATTPATAPAADKRKVDTPKPGTRAKGDAAGRPAAQLAATMLRRNDGNGDGTIDIAAESVQPLGTTAAGTSAQSDRTQLLRAADASGDGQVTREELQQYVATHDRDGDQRLDAAERRALADANHAAIQTTAIAADGTRTETTRGFFQSDGQWYFRNEWGSVARAQRVPSNPRVVDAPDGFDQATVPALPGGVQQATTTTPATRAGQAAQPTTGRGGRTAALRGAAAIFDRPGIFVDQPQNFSDDQARAARAAGFTWIAMQGAHADDQGTPVRRDDFTAEWVARMKSLGFEVGIWNVLGSNPVEDARTAAAQIRERDLDFFIADAENAHKADTGGDPARSRAFTDEFRRLQPDTALALSSFAAANAPNLLGSVTDRTAGPMDYTAWYEAGAVFMPQVYPEEFGPVYSLANTMDHARRAGWDPSRVKPTLGFHRGETPEYYADLAAAGTNGFSVYLGEHVTDASYWQRLVAQD